MFKFVNIYLNIFQIYKNVSNNVLDVYIREFLIYNIKLSRKMQGLGFG